MINEIFLFPGKAPGSEHVIMEEVVFEEAWENRTKRIVQGVTAPSIFPYLPERPNGAAMLVIPGGAYRRQVLSLEGSEIAEWLNSLGVTVFVLKHRMPGDGHENATGVPLQDAQRAMRLIRSQASRWGLKSDKIGVMGFSAGGHLASTVGTCYDHKVYAPIDSVDELSAKPDFLVLCYPCITINQDEEAKHPPALFEVVRKYGTDQFVTPETPQSFIMVADDDRTTPAEHSISFYLALRRAGVPSELHCYKSGGHGFGLGKTKGAVQEWTVACKNWLDSVL
jgi:acetyl esterase/lipase